MRLDLHVDVRCVDGPVGSAADMVVDPRALRLTHIVIDPKDSRDRARLVPTADAEVHGDRGEIMLRRTTEEINRLEPVRGFAYVLLGETPAQDPGWEVGIQDVSPLAGPESLGPEAFGAGISTAPLDQHVAISFDRIPSGSVEIRRTSPVASSEGHHLGHVVGFVVEEEDDHRITHLVLEHGHLWGKHEVAIPAAALERLENDAVTLNLTSEQVQQLGSLPRHH